MYEPPGLVHVDGPLASPRVQLLPVDALMGGEVEAGIPHRRFPLVGDEADVPTTHGTLPEEVETVLYSIVSVQDYRLGTTP